MRIEDLTDDEFTIAMNIFQGKLNKYVKLVGQCKSNKGHLEPDEENNLCNHCCVNLETSEIFKGIYRNKEEEESSNYVTGLKRYLDSLK